MSARKHAGIEARHHSGCPAANGGKCSCKPAYRAEVWSPSENRRIRKTFPTFSAAKGWRDDHAGIKTRAKLRTDPGPTIREAGKAWMAAAETGGNLTRSGDRYKPSALRGYEQALRLRIYPELGGRRLRDVTRADLQRFVTKINAKGKPSTVRNTMNALRAIYRDALAHGHVDANPTTGLRMPAVRGKREKITNRTGAAALIEHAPDTERALSLSAKLD